ncbi:hypothetical protein ACH4KU_23960 [Streptomyces althioticus]|uniref:hypothetical protein n=1 Tax=Streptomyces althioticus TaxID=83380 RepID=UPI0033E40A84
MNEAPGAAPGHGARHVTARGAGRHLRRALMALLLACLVWSGAAEPADAADGDDLVKVFVVPDPSASGGRTVTLPDVAAGTLGDASRSPEIFDLNRELTQPDGTALTSPDEQLHPGWILRLPQDATGDGVQLARDNGGQEPSPGPAAGTGTTTVFAVPLGTVVAVLGAVVMALVTAGIVARRRLRTAWSALVRLLRRLGEPFRARRRLAARRALGRRFAADTDAPRRARLVLNRFRAAEGASGAPVHAVRIDAVGATVWLPSTSAAPEPWKRIDSTRWSLSATEDRRADGEPVADEAACPVRAGTDTEGVAVFVDLSRLDGVLSVVGDAATARDAVRNVLEEVARGRPGTPVTVLGDRTGPLVPVVPPGLREVPPLTPAPVAPPLPSGTRRIAAARRPVQGLVVLATPPTDHEAAQLAALCGTGGAGWTGLVCGEVAAAHWRWYADAEGRVDVPLLGLRLTVPA